MFGRVAILAILGIINLILFSRMVWGPTGLVEYHGLKKQHLAMQEQIASLDAENLALSREIRLLRSDKAYMEKMIRQRLHYMRENELLYIFDHSNLPDKGVSVK